MRTSVCACAERAGSVREEAELRDDAVLAKEHAQGLLGHVRGQVGQVQRRVGRRDVLVVLGAEDGEPVELGLFVPDRVRAQGLRPRTQRAWGLVSASRGASGWAANGTGRDGTDPYLLRARARQLDDHVRRDHERHRAAVQRHVVEHADHWPTERATDEPRGMSARASARGRARAKGRGWRCDRIPWLGGTSPYRAAPAGGWSSARARCGACCTGS